MTIETRVSHRRAAATAVRLAVVLAALLLADGPRVAAQEKQDGSPDPAAERQEAIDRHLAEANRLRAERQPDPEAPGVRESKHLEGVELFQAALLGDDTQKARRETIVAELRGDEELPPEARAELVGYLGNLEVARKAGLGFDERVAEHEKVTRAIIAEFPGVEAAYESLVNIARVRPAAEALAIAEEILGNPAVPGHLSLAAFEMKLRCELVGTALADMAPVAAEGDRNLEHTRGRRTIVYSWDSGHAGSLWLARQVAELAPAGALIIGVNLDADIEAAKALAASESLPGEQIYGDESARDYEIRARLRLIEPALVYVTDGDGVLESVSAQRNLPGLLAGGDGR